MKNFVIIPSGGMGLRTGKPIPKQYLKFKGKELIAHTISIFQNSPLIDEIIIPAQKDYLGLIKDIREKYNFKKLSSIVEGGENRQASVYKGLLACNASDNDLIIVHDAVRPLVSQSILTNAIKLASQKGSAVVATPAKDTLFKGNEKVVEYVKRENIFYVQTPQIFTHKILWSSMQKALNDSFLGTDESMLVKNAGFDVNICEGSSLNFKITTAEDIQLFEIICDNRLDNL